MHADSWNNDMSFISGPYFACCVQMNVVMGAIVPIFRVFTGVASIVTTLLSPNPFDELANYLDEFKQKNNRLTDIQADL